MNKAICLIFLQVFLLCCNAEKAIAVDEKAIPDIIKHYFSSKAKVNKENQPYFSFGDFNGDGIEDIAILFYPHDNVNISKQVQISTPWSFSNNEQSNKYHQSLAILHGGSESWVSPKTQIFALLDKSGVLETPSFKLIVKRHTDHDFAQHQTILPVKSNRDFIILPTEAGIDTYVYWNNTSYKLFVPEEIP